MSRPPAFFLLAAAAIAVLLAGEFRHTSYAPYALAIGLAIAAAVAAAWRARASEARSTLIRARLGLAAALAALAVWGIAWRLLATEDATDVANGLALAAWVPVLASAGAVLLLLPTSGTWARWALLAAPLGRGISATLSTVILLGGAAPVPLIRELDALAIGGHLVALASCGWLLWARGSGHRAQAIPA
jgi:hypothetical protein